MDFTLQILCLQLLQKEYEDRIAAMGKIDCNNEKKVS